MELWSKSPYLGQLLLTCLLLIFMIGYIFYRGIPYLSWELLTSQSSYVKQVVGIFPNLLNTLYIIIVAMTVVLPLVIGAAVYLTEYASNRKMVNLIEFAAESLTGIPSIIFGLVGMVLFAELFGLKQGILAGGLTLVMMILPVSNIIYNNENIYAPKIDVTWLRKRIGMVFQKPNPFPMSIYDNVAYGPRTHGITSKVKLDAIVEKSLKDATIWDEVKDRF